MTTSTFSVRYRPVKIGFLLRDGAIEDIIEASELNTLLWGGIYNPLIPVSQEVSFAKQLIRLFNVDVLFPVTNTKEIRALSNGYKYLASPHYFNKEILYENWHSKKLVPGYLDVINIIDFYWETEFKNKSKKYRSNCALVEWSKDDTLDSLFTVAFGRFPKGLNLKYDYRNAFLRGLRAKRVVLKTNESIDRKLSRVIHPLALTRDRLQGDGGSLREDGIYVGESGSFEDLLTFWNLRASGLDLQFLPTDSERLALFVRQHLSTIDRIPNQHPNIEDSISVYSRDINSAKTDASPFVTKKRNIYCRVGKIIWNGLNIKPAGYYFNDSQVLGNVDERLDKFSVSIALPEKPTKGDHGNVNSQDIVVVADPITEFEYPEHTLKLPFIQELNEFYSRQIVLDPWQVRVDREGIGLIKRVSDNVIHLYPIPNSSLVEKVFHSAGIKAQMSQAGRLAYWIIQQMREYDPLEACRVFKIRGVRILIKGLSSKKAVKHKDALRIIGSNHFDRFKRLYIEQRKQLELTPGDVWNYLIKKRIFAPTLPRKQPISQVKKSFRCSRCGLKSKIRCGDFLKDWKCGFCAHRQYLPQFITDVFERNEIEVFDFKKSRLFARDNNQEGAIPVILTLLQIKRVFDDSNFIYSTSLQLEPRNGKPCETDIAVLNYGREDKIEVGIGECKSNCGRIDEKDITNLKNIREHLESKGLRCYLVFSKTTDEFTEGEIRSFKKLVEEDIHPVLFTNKELEPYDPYMEPRETDLPKQYAFTLEDMAMNSAHIYLR